jgi:hypothetical protein
MDEALYIYKNLCKEISTHEVVTHCHASTTLRDEVASNNIKFSRWILLHGVTRLLSSIAKQRMNISGMLIPLILSVSIQLLHKSFISSLYRNCYCWQIASDSGQIDQTFLSRRAVYSDTKRFPGPLESNVMYFYVCQAAGTLNNLSSTTPCTCLRNYALWVTFPIAKYCHWLQTAQ